MRRNSLKDSFTQRTALWRKMALSNSTKYTERIFLGYWVQVSLKNARKTSLRNVSFLYSDLVPKIGDSLFYFIFWNKLKGLQLQKNIIQSQARGHGQRGRTRTQPPVKRSYPPGSKLNLTHLMRLSRRSQRYSLQVHTVSKCSSASGLATSDLNFFRWSLHHSALTATP
jgi:hypothetical protein